MIDGDRLEAEICAIKAEVESQCDGFVVSVVASFLERMLDIVANQPCLQIQTEFCVGESEANNGEKKS